MKKTHLILRLTQQVRKQGVQLRNLIDFGEHGQVMWMPVKGSEKW